VYKASNNSEDQTSLSDKSLIFTQKS